MPSALDVFGKKRHRAWSITDAERQEVIAMHKGGAQRQKICAELSMSAPTVRKILREAGYRIGPVTKNEITPEMREKIIQLRQEGWPFSQIAEKVGCGKRAVMTIVADSANEMPTHAGSTVSPEEFIRVWQTSDTAAEVKEKLGLSTKAILNRAYKYREHGVKLKKLRYTERVFDWDGLAEFADLFIEDEQQFNDTE